MPRLFVTPLGVPTPQGSLAYKGLRKGKPIMVSDNSAKLKPWRAIIAAATVEARAGIPTIDEPVKVTAEFVMPAPKKPRWWLPAVKPDLDKLARALLDGLADGGLYANDSRVVVLNLSKVYGSSPGAWVEVEWGDEL